MTISNCAAPIIIHYENRYYKKESAVNIFPMYGNVNQLLYYTQAVPVFDQLGVDEKSMIYENMQIDPLTDPEKEDIRVFYIIISTKF